MPVKVSLETTQANFEHLHKQADSRGLAVKVEREALSRLLIDHTRLCRALAESTSFKLEEPAKVKVRERRP